jgi:hypothetical protein
MPPSGSHTPIGPWVSPWYPPRQVRKRFRSGRPTPRWYCNAVFNATSTATDPESE